MTLAERFLRRFRSASLSASPDDNPLQALLKDADGFADLLAADPEQLRREFEADAARARGGPAFAHAQAFASAACNSDGRILAGDPRLAAWLEDAGAGRLTGVFAGRTITWLARDGAVDVAVAAGAGDAVHAWPLAPEVRACLESGKARIAALAFHPALAGRGAVPAAARCFGFTGLEARVAAGLVATGHARGAAAQAGVSYETARDALKSAMRKAGSRRQGEFVSLCLALQAGDAADPPACEAVLQDMFGLTLRQARIALAVAAGQARAEIGTQLRLSAHVVKDELKVVFEACAVESMGALAALVARLQALASLANATDVELRTSQAAGEPLRLVPRAGRQGRIAVADHGPVEAAPVLLLSTATTGRHLPASHVADLQALGLRPIAFDRPGIGLSTPIGGDYLDECADDMADILDALGLERAHVVARAGALVFAHFARRHAGRLARAVVCNPEPALDVDSRYRGMLGPVKSIVYNNPGLIESFAASLARRASFRMVEALVLHALGGSPADERLLADPVFRSAYIRSTLQSAQQQGAGFISITLNEPRCAVSTLEDGAHISVLWGAEDQTYEPGESGPRWEAAWPGCHRAIVPGAGRLLPFQRPDLIAGWLLQR